MWRPGRAFRPVLARPLIALGLLCAPAHLVENAWQSWAAVHLCSPFAGGPGVASKASVRWRRWSRSCPVL
jgi:hypothetical protein